MSQHQSKDPLHGVTLEQLLNKLVDHYGWSELGARIRINCFRSDPSIKSSLKFCVARPGRAKRWKTCISIWSAIPPQPAIIPGCVGETVKFDQRRSASATSARSSAWRSSWRSCL